jgi:D-lyxose ketol-isomerase
VSIYPTATEDLQLAQIEQLRRRFPTTAVGWSGHEDPDDVLPMQLAVAFGARMFERHVGIPFEGSPLNAYSMSPEQVDGWLTAYRRAVTACGERTRRPDPTEEELASLDGLQRGVYARNPIEAGAALARDDVYFAMPAVPGQLHSGEWSAAVTTRVALEPDAPALVGHLDRPSDAGPQAIYTAIHTVKAMLNEAKIVLPTDFTLEISHHYGMERFEEFGTVIFDCINREYCKKLLVQLPGQKNPLHYHRRKEETFQVLSGVLELEIDGRRRTMHPGETLLVQPGVWHAFWTWDGAIFEEISTTHYNDDSFYADKDINRMERSERKTVVDHWGRHQIRPL